MVRAWNEPAGRRARLLSPRIDLPFEERVGFEPNADGSFDKFSRLRVRD